MGNERNAELLKVKEQRNEGTKGKMPHEKRTKVREMEIDGINKKEK